jgi:hypothetical protein
LSRIPPTNNTANSCSRHHSSYSRTDNNNEGESVGNSEGEDNEDNEDLSDIMGPKKVPAAAAAAPKKAPAKSGNVDALADLLQGATVTKGAAKKPAFTSYSTKVEDPLLIRTVFVDGEQWVEFDMSIAATLLCGDGINAVLASDGRGISLQRGVYSSTARTVAGSQLIAKCVTNSRRRRRVREMESCTVSANLSSFHASVQDWSKRSSLGEFRHPSRSHSLQLRLLMAWKLRRQRSTFNYGEQNLQGEDGFTA